MPDQHGAVTDTLSLRRALTATIALLLVAGVLSAAVVSGDDPDTTDVATTDATTTLSTVLSTDTTDPDATTASTDLAAPAPSSPDTGSTTGDGVRPGAPADNRQGGSSAPAAGGGPATTAAPGPATTAAPGGSGFADLGAAASGGAVQVPKAGTYRYKTVAKEADGTTKESEGSNKVEDKGAAPNGTRNLVFTILGQGFDSVSDIGWGPDEVLIKKSTLMAGGRQADCDWSPDYLELKIALAKGVTWDARSSCQITGFGPAPIMITRSAKSTVSDARRIRIAGQELDVWVITGTETFEGGGRSGTASSTTWFWGQGGVVVRSVTEGDQGSATREIQNLQPA